MDFIGGALPNVMFIVGIIAIGIGLGIEFKLVEIKGELSKRGRYGALGVGAALIMVSVFLYTRPAQTASAPLMPASTPLTVGQMNANVVAAAPAQATAVVQAAPQNPPVLAPATAAPAVPTIAPPIPSATSAQSIADPVVDMRTLLVAGVADGRIDKDGDELIKKLREFQEALSKDDQKQAAERLRDLQKKLNEGAEKDSFDQVLVQDALGMLQRIATQYNLTAVAHDD
jgi:hypothetical protein